MLIGYARTSTDHQDAGLEAQIERLAGEGCGKVFSEQASSVGERSALDRALEYIREGDGDVLVVTKLDRLARSLPHLFEIVERLRIKGAALKVLDSPIDMTTPYGELVLQILGAIAEFERKLMLCRQKDGIAAAKREGKYRGRAPTVRRQAGEIRRLKAEGLGAGAIAKRLGVHRASVYRILGEPVPAGDSPAK